jgi:hypothetical protein
MCFVSALRVCVCLCAKQSLHIANRTEHGEWIKAGLPLLHLAVLVAVLYSKRSTRSACLSIYTRCLYCVVSRSFHSACMRYGYLVRFSFIHADLLVSLLRTQVHSLYCIWSTHTAVLLEPPALLLLCTAAVWLSYLLCSYIHIQRDRGVE